jgi:maleylacetate reductase
MANTSLHAGPIPPGMDAVHVGEEFTSTVLAELQRLASSRVFVIANRSSATLAGPLVTTLEQKGLLAAPLCTAIGMGGGEEGLLGACDAAAAADADAVVTIGGGAVHDAGKLVRLWLAAAAARKRGHSDSTGGASLDAIRAVTERAELELAPQVCAPNSFAMAELTSVAGATTKANVKSGAAHPALMPTVIVYDPALSAGLPDWVRFGTALRGIEHGIGAVCSSSEGVSGEVIDAALEGLRLVVRGLEGMVAEPTAREAQLDCYRGGWVTIRALNTAGYPALAHFVQNHYSARFNVHQGACSGILSARILRHHAAATAPQQARLAAALGAPDEPAPRQLQRLVARLPGLSQEHAEVQVTPAALREFAEWLYATHAPKLNRLSAVPFASAEAVLEMLAWPLASL